MADTDKTPLTKSDGAPTEAVDYEAIFEGHGSKHEGFAQETILGECRNPRRISVVEWVFMAVATVSLLGVLAITIERLVYFNDQFVSLVVGYNTSNETAAPCDTWVCTNDFTYTILILVNIGFCALYCYDGLFRERPFEILAYVAAAAVIIIYIIVNYIVNGSEGQALRIVRLALVCVLGPLNILLALLSWWKMGYFVLNVIGTNTQLIRAYRIRSFFLTAQLFHLELFCNLFVLAWSQQGQFLELWEKVVVTILLVYTVCVTVASGIAVLWELKVLACIWFGLILPCGGYYLYKLIEVSINFHWYQQEYTEITEDRDPDTVDLTYTGGGLLFACIFGLVVVAVLLVFMALSLMSFGKGLRNKIHPPLGRFLKRVGSANSHIS